MKNSVEIRQMFAVSIHVCCEKKVLFFLRDGRRCDPGDFAQKQNHLVIRSTTP